METFEHFFLNKLWVNVHSIIYFHYLKFCSIPLLSRVQLFATPWTAACQVSLFTTKSPQLAQTLVHSLGDAIRPSHPLSDPSHPTFNHSQHHGFSNESAVHITKYWNFTLSLSPSNEYSELISFRVHWFDLLAVQGTLKSLLQNHSSKASILLQSVFFMVDLKFIHDYWKNKSFYLWTFISKVMSLLFNIQRLVM